MDKRMVFVVFILCIIVDFAFCRCDVKIALKSGQDIELTSPGYPSNFSNNLHCFYDLTTEFNSGNVLHVLVQDVSLSCDDRDTRLEVFDAFNTNPRYLGKVCVGGAVKFVSPKERLYLVFRSSSGGPNEATHRGFKLRVMSVPEYSNCYNHQAKVLSALPEMQHIVSPYYPFEVAPNVHCRWLLKAPQGFRVRLDIVNADMKGSNDCHNFGLYIFDGKTTYDDVRLGSVCSNNSQTFYSSSNYLLVVFLSESHVLQSGGGVKLGYYSFNIDPSEVGKDSSLLFILIGVLLAVTSFTVIFIFLRVFILRARRRRMVRQFNHGQNDSRAISHFVDAIPLPLDPPPPYGIDDHSCHKKNGSRFWAATCGCCCLDGKTDNYRNSQQPSRHFVNNFTFVTDTVGLGPGQVSPHLLTRITGDSLGTVFDVMQSANSPAVIRNRIHSGEVTFNRSSMLLHENEYHELPPLGIPQTLPSTIIEEDDEIDDSANMRVSEGQTTRYRSIDSGYQEGVEDVGDLDNDRSNIVETHHTPEINEAAGNECPHVNTGNLYSPSEGLSNGYHSLNEGICSNSLPRDQDSSGTSREVDENDYEISVSCHVYDSLRNGTLGDEEEKDGVYQTIHFNTNNS